MSKLEEKILILFSALHWIQPIIIWPITMQPNNMQPNTQFLILQKKYQINLAQTQFSGPGRFRPGPFNHRFPFPGSRPKNLGLGRESAAPSRPPPARSAPSAREPLDLIQRPAFLPRPYKNGARSPGPQTLDHLFSSSLSSPDSGSGERRWRGD